jgi:hypothetical protein
MPDLSAMLLRRSLRSPRGGSARCSSCKRTPLAGERMHELGSGPLLCELCFGDLPEDRRLAVRSERIGASERRLAVVPKAA